MSLIDYKKLSLNDLKLLILANDDKAIDEHLRRVKSGEIKTKTYTIEQLEQMAYEAAKKAS